MVEFVAVDASKVDQGSRSFLLGVALEISNGSKFDDYYFDLVNEFSEKYDLELGHNIIKSTDITNRIASFEITEAQNFVVENLLNNPAIRRIHVTIGWYLDDIVVGGRGNSTSGIRFTNDILSQYFPIITLWNYHRLHPDWDVVPNEAWIDNVQGKITKAWKYVGNEFKLNVVPHGDLTYPSLSTADIIGNYLSRILPVDRPLDRLEDIAFNILVDKVDSQPRVKTAAVNQAMDDSDHMVPNHRYSIQSELHFPHPVMFMYDDVFAELDRPVLAETDFHSYARKWAQDNSGCVIKMEPHRLPSIVRSGDHIVYTRGTNPEICELLRDLNPSKDIHLLDSDQFLQEMEYE